MPESVKEEIEEMKEQVEEQPTLEEYMRGLSEQMKERIKALPPLPKDYPLLRKYVELYYDVQKERIQMRNRITSYLWLQAARRGEVKEGDRRARGKFSKLADDYIKHKVDVPDDVAYLVELHNYLFEAERVLAIKLAEFANNHPFYTAYLRHVKGIGPILATAIIAYGPYSRFATVSKLWKYAGMAPGQGPGNPDKKYNRKMKVTFYKAAMQFVKLSDRSPYGRLYKKFRAEYDQKWEDRPKYQRYWASLRKVAKLFASHVWAKWWEVVEGKKAPTKPYPFVHQDGHADYYDPDDFTDVKV